MLIAISRMARGELRVADVDRETDHPQSAYLAALSRNRVRRGGDALADFYREAMSRALAPAPDAISVGESAIHASRAEPPAEKRRG